MSDRLLEGLFFHNYLKYIRWEVGHLFHFFLPSWNWGSSCVFFQLRV